MRLALAFFLWINCYLFAIQTDFDVAVVGTSPTSILEAIYHIARQERVLILESDKTCGGAWKSIDICGIAHADLGCHLIGGDRRLKEFFENYFGCKFVCLEHPKQEANQAHMACSNGFYFSGGCYELISRLEAKITAQANGRLLKQKLESIFVDTAKEYIELNLGNRHYTTHKLIVTNASCFRIDNPGFANAEPPKHPYNHLYMLIEDQNPSHFTYVNGVATGMSRAMNLTPFLQMPYGNWQLIAVQVHGKIDSKIKEAQKFLEAFITKGLLGPQAKVISVESYDYNSSSMNMANLQKLGGSLIEVLDTSSFAGMTRYFDKWKTAMVPVR